ncbi:MAG: CHAT domain-containing protein, partial [Candidatus Eisenbacteria bacterium]|nr:CHAT domain-containing protein [Candidatus Eisenbacteria bacterium]
YRQAVDLVIASGASRAARIAVDLLALARSPLVVEDLQHAAGEEFRPEVRGAMVRLRAELLAKAPEARTEGLRVRSLQDQMRRLDRLLLEGPTKPPMLVRRAMANRSLARWLPGLGTREVVFFDRGTPWRAFVIRPNGEVVHVELPFAQGALAESWLALRTNFDIASRSPAAHRSGFIDRTTESCLHHLGQLRRALWDPLPLTHERIVVVPIGELHGVPLEALGDEAGHIVSRTPHPALLSRGRSHRPRRALVLAGEDAEMEAEAREAASILEQTGWTVVRSDHVDVEMARGGAIGLLHVAAHGTFHREGWLFSGIDLPHGRLYFEDLRRTRLRDALILLTSCDSGRVDSLPGSNVEGWITAGLSAGARELVLAGWKIDGGNARRFAHEFHRRWNGAADAAPAVAFGRASLRARHPHPHGWAGYMVAG